MYFVNLLPLSFKISVRYVANCLIPKHDAALVNSCLLQGGTVIVWKADISGRLTVTPLSTCQASGDLTHVILNTCNMSPAAESP